MSLIKSTGWMLAQNGGITNLRVSASHIVSARLRWRGKDKRLSRAITASEPTNIVDFPDTPAGWIKEGGYASYAVTVKAFSASDHGSVSVRAPGGADSVTWALDPFDFGRFTAATNCAGTGTAVGDTTGEYVTFSNPVITARADFYKDIQTEQLRATVNNVTIAGPAALANGVVSDWYSISNLLIGDNTVAHNIASSEQADIEIEYTYQPSAPPPARHTPEHYAVTDNGAQPFEMTLLRASGSDAATLHGRVRLSLMPDMSDPTVYDSSAIQRGWQYLDGATWKDMPAGGVASGTRVRLTPAVLLAVGVWYWTAAAKDWAWGAETDPAWALRRVLSVNALEGYSLAVGSTLWPCKTLVITESSNGELSTIEFSVSNMPNTEGKTAYNLISYGDPVYLSVYDSTGKEQQFLGRVIRKDPSDFDMKILAGMGDKILADRLCSSDYTGQDIGTALKNIIDTDCAPLLSKSIPSPFGVTVNLVAKNRQALEVWQEAFKTFGLAFWCETDALDWVMYLADPSKLSPQGIIVEFPMEGAG